MKLNIKKIALIVVLYIVIDVLISYLNRGAGLSQSSWLMLGLISILIPLLFYGIIKLISDKVREKMSKRRGEKLPGEIHNSDNGLGNN